ncbi:ASCH domain-containing protein [Lapidilactobacillus gannanensis]|uniref:ASCH domain-containing protein n=1 Tax=Lapidilactobacillus gannanensis TaxID=2486002 RepID=A0ABW4BIL8_9LACO|nr:ASCH domain-containing protein [Lapidilactobacillus gannanensis]MCH4056481.1 ASCH domain-containing protein [Lactobacillaceae bacterium]
MVHLSAADYWRRFQEKNSGLSDQFQAWSFGDSPQQADELLALVLSGKKVGTASLYQLYRWTNEPLPQVGDYSIILDGAQQPRCIIQTTKIDVVPFADVTAAHAAAEGEGDLSLDYWREVHWQFFSHESAAARYQFNEQDLVVCELFKVVPGSVALAQTD